MKNYPRPPLQRVPLPTVLPNCLIVTMSPGQWDKFLWSAYKGHALLLEMDENEMPVKAFQLQPAG